MKTQRDRTLYRQFILDFGDTVITSVTTGLKFSTEIESTTTEESSMKAVAKSMCESTSRSAVISNTFSHHRNGDKVWFAW